MKLDFEYRLAHDGQIMVRERHNAERPASAKEWLSIWLFDPKITLRLAA